MAMNRSSWLFRYRLALGLFIVGLVLSGLTAFALETELSLLSRFFGISNPSNYAEMQGVRRWIAFLQFGFEQTYPRFAFFGYGTDWLAFGHLVIATFFVLPFREPVRYRGVLHVALVACLGVIILAVICGPIRQIPFYWTLIDCSFGVIGAIPLLYCLHLSRKFT
jgi:hypothetical protein